MMHRLKWLVAGLTAALLLPLAAAPAAAQAQELKVPPGDWHLAGVGASFPETIGEYERVSVHQYGPNDWSVGYNLYRGGKLVSVITVYLYPESAPGAPCAAEFEGVKQAIVRARAGAAKLVEDVAASPRGSREGAALHARYAFSMSFGGGAETQVHSDAYLYCRPGSRWWIKYRSTWPAATDRSAEAMGILRGIRWADDLAE